MMCDKVVSPREFLAILRHNAYWQDEPQAPWTYLCAFEAGRDAGYPSHSSPYFELTIDLTKKEDKLLK